MEEGVMKEPIEGVFEAVMRRGKTQGKTANVVFINKC
jgi:hypothetical protein